MNHQKTYEFFPQEAVDEWVRTKLSKYYKVSDVATLVLREDETAPEVIVKFAELAKALKLPVTTDGYGTLKIQRAVPMDQQRKSAAEEMQRAHERGQIDDEGHTVES